MNIGSLVKQIVSKLDEAGAVPGRSRQTPSLASGGMATGQKKRGGLLSGQPANVLPEAMALQQQGRNGDTLLAHITPEEAGWLHKKTDGASVNPKTGLLEFWTGEGDTDSGAGPGVATDAGSDAGGPDAGGPDGDSWDILPVKEPETTPLTAQQDRGLLTSQSMSYLLGQPKRPTPVQAFGRLVYDPAQGRYVMTQG